MSEATQTPINLVVLGAPGAGKGTQAAEFAQRHEILKISTGDILRDAVQSGTELGQRAKATMDAGGLVDDQLMIAIVRERLSRADAVGGFVLDGFPRTVAQATALDEIMATVGNSRFQWVAERRCQTKSTSSGEKPRLLSSSGL